LAAAALPSRTELLFDGVKVVQPAIALENITHSYGERLALEGVGFLFLRAKYLALRGFDLQE